MNKQELVEALSKNTGLTKAACEQTLKAFTEIVTKAMKKNEPIQLVGFGTFTTTKRAARKGKNPQTGEAIKIPAAVVPKFRPGKALKDAVNSKKK